MGPSGMSPMGLNPTRAAGMAPLYAGQRLPQHGYPGPPQAQPLPRQGVKRAYSSEVRASLAPAASRGEEPAVPGRVGPTVPAQELASPTPVLLGILPLSIQVCPGQQYLPGGQYAPGTTQYAAGAGQPPAPSAYPGHRLPLQQGAGQSLSSSGPVGLHYKVGPAPLGLLLAPCQALGWLGSGPV